jgi:hypothetical protein
MIMADAIHERGKALEAEYFHRVDEALLNRMRESIRRTEASKQLGESLGFKDNALIEHLLDAGLDSTSISAMALVPLVFIAWSDDGVSTAERQLVMSEAIHRGLSSQENAMRLVEHWLEKRPSQRLWVVWCEYHEALRQSLPTDIERALSHTILSRCEAVAKASSSIWGMDRISKPEQEMLQRIKQTLHIEP